LQFLCYNYGGLVQQWSTSLKLSVGLQKPSLKEKENYHAQTKGVYVNRAFGGDCHYRIIDGDTYAGAAAGEKAGMEH